MGTPWIKVTKPWPIRSPCHASLRSPLSTSAPCGKSCFGLALAHPPCVMAARFHKGLAGAIVAMVLQLNERNGERTIGTVALSGGVFQNKILLEQVARGLRELGFAVLTHQRVPANDGGLSLGQAIVAAARALDNRGAPCV